jgi:hypothetical protein
VRRNFPAEEVGEEYDILAEKAAYQQLETLHVMDFMTWLFLF